MDFIVGLPRTAKGFDPIWVIIDWLIKTAHFLPVKTYYSVITYAQIYVARILSLHGVTKTIVLDGGPQFVSKFWEELHRSLGTKLLHSSAYHPQTSGQTERVNQILEDMLRACVTEPPKSLGPPKVVLVQRTLDNPVDAHNHSTSSVYVFFSSPKSVSPVTQIL
jgi:transposase InsO family protein